MTDLLHVHGVARLLTAASAGTELKAALM
jgi:hypothetical protein